MKEGASPVVGKYLRLKLVQSDYVCRFLHRQERGRTSPPFPLFSHHRPASSHLFLSYIHIVFYIIKVIYTK